MLTDAQIRKIKPTDKKERYYDEKSMYLEVTPAGGMYWRLKYRFNKLEKVYSIGTYPEISLANARLKRDDARRQILDGKDPNAVKREQKEIAAGKMTFGAVYSEWLDKKEAEWSKGSFERAKSRFENDVLPYIGKRPIADITASELLTVIQRIEKRTVDTAHRALGECGQIFRYGMANGRNNHDPSPALHKAITKRKGKNFAAFTRPADLADMLKAFNGFKGTYTVRCALYLAPMLFARIGELRRAKWAEIDLDAGCWEYYVTKTKQDHLVPLPRQAIDLLREMKGVNGNSEYVFPGHRSRLLPMSGSAINGALQRLGFDTKEEITGHGFRATARTILRERLGYERDFIERQLSHKTSEIHGTAYDRAMFLEQRMGMMQAWADYLDELRTDSNVIRFVKPA